MNGFPNWINSRQDVDNLLVEYPEQMKALLQKWLDNRMAWITTAKLESAEAGATDDTHRVQTVEMEGSETEYYQQEYMEDPSGTLARIGITAVEAQAIVGA